MYEKIMFLGWRRCGDYIYRPILEKNCCKMYSIRMDSTKFKINKNQKKILRNFKQYLIKKFNKEDDKMKVENIEINTNSKHTNKDTNNKGFNIYNNDENTLIQLLTKFLKEDKTKELIFNEFKINQNNYQSFISENNFIKIFPCKNKNQGEISSTFFIALYSKFKKDIEGKNLNSENFYAKMYFNINEFFSVLNLTEEIQVNLSKTGHVNFKFFSNEILEKYRLSNFLNSSISNKQKENNDKKPNAQGDDSNKLNQKETSFLYSPLEHIYDEPTIFKSELINTYTIELDINSNITDEKFNIYIKYQKIIHKDKESDLSKSRYKQSWGTSNLLSNSEFDFENLKGTLTKEQLNLLPKKFGTYDLVHKINGKIVAVGIIDIMPQSISQKMKYKGEYFPSEILCPYTLKFYSLEDKNVQRILKEKKNEPLAIDEPKHLNLLMNDSQLDEIIKELKIYYVDMEYPLYFFLTEVIDESYVNTFILLVRKLIKYYGLENLKKTKLTIN